MRKLFEIMEICSNICSLRDAPISRPFSVSESVASKKCAKNRKKDKYRIMTYEQKASDFTFINTKQMLTNNKNECLTCYTEIIHCMNT